MPRKQQRFAFLEKALKLTGGTSGGVLAEYQKFKQGNRDADGNLTNGPTRRAPALTSAQLKRVAYAILPFGITPPGTPTAADRYVVALTVYSNTWRTAGGSLSNAEVGYSTLEAGNEENPVYYPAVLKVSVPGSGAALPDARSGITKRPYNYKPTNTYSIPFGRKAASTNDEKERFDVLKNSVRATLGAAGVRSIGYLPEEFQPSGAAATAGT